MPFGLYKQDQGRWSRGIAAAGLTALGLWGALKTHDWMENYTGAGSFYAGWWIPGLILAAFASLAFYVSNRPKVADFIIETETEMKKVTWPTYREVLGATAVVIVVVIILGVFLFGVDRMLIQPFFELIGILDGGAAGS